MKSHPGGIEHTRRMLELAELPAGENFKRCVNKAGVELLSGIMPLPENEKLALMEECGR